MRKHPLHGRNLQKMIDRYIPSAVQICEVSARDGLQSLNVNVETSAKIQFIQELIEAGCTHLEVASFVNPKLVPLMADSAAVLAALPEDKNLTLAALVPNVKGLDFALDSKATLINVFASASEAFSQSNMNASIDECLHRIEDIVAKCPQKRFYIRATISCMTDCPVSGRTSPKLVRDLTVRLLDIGCDDVFLADTLGKATPATVQQVIEMVLVDVMPNKLGVHFHDTYGQGVANVWQSLQYGISKIDSSAAGIGGCPFARGASGNVATEDVLYLLQSMGIDTGIDLMKLAKAGQKFCRLHGIQYHSKVGRAILKENEIMK